MNEIREESLASIVNLDDSLTQLDQLLQQLKDPSLLSVRQQAEFHTLVTFAMNTLSYVYLKTKGTETKSHTVKTELARTQKYLEKTEQKKSRNLEVDKEAANRFIHRGLQKPLPKPVHTRLDGNPAPIVEDRKGDDQMVAKLEAGLDATKMKEVTKVMKKLSEKKARKALNMVAKKKRAALRAIKKEKKAEAS